MVWDSGEPCRQLILAFEEAAVTTTSNQHVFEHCQCKRACLPGESTHLLLLKPAIPLDGTVDIRIRPSFSYILNNTLNILTTLKTFQFDNDDLSFHK